MKKLILIISIGLFIFLSACNPSTIKDTTEAVTSTTSEVTTDLTTIINQEISIRLNNGVDTVEINSEWIDNGATLLINGARHPMVTFDTVDVTEKGIYQIRYTYNYQEVVYEINRYVIVLDQIPPVLTLNLGIDTITLGQDWLDTGATVIENSGETITIITTGSVDINTAGTYVITYTATDSSDNIAVVYRYVTVIE